MDAKQTVVLTLLLLSPATGAYGPPGEPTRLIPEVQEPVTRVLPPNNGAGPLWCYGAPLIVRDGSNVYVSISETGPDVPPLCNTRWRLWLRDRDGWRVLAAEADYREREPCPLVRLGPKTLLLSANPSLEPPGTHYGRCRPTAVLFRLMGNQLTMQRESPAWENNPTFTDHSYRGIAADADRHEALLLNIDARTSEQYVSFRTGSGQWFAIGKIRFPIRSCYPQVALRNRQAAVLAIGDIVEPVPEWRALKRSVLKRHWDYVFRRLFYTWTPDVREHPFAAPVEIDSAEETCGHILNLDLHIDASGRSHVLYLKRRFQYDFIRDRFFPNQPQVQTLMYAVLSGGRVIRRRALIELREGQPGIEPTYARFHVAPDERLHALIAGVDRRGPKAVFRNYWADIDTDGHVSRLAPVDWERPFSRFFTATPRGGSQPGPFVDVFGTIVGENGRLWYGRARIVPQYH